MIPTSNHNLMRSHNLAYLVVYLLIPTSNHNLVENYALLWQVVYLLIPTSNHNQRVKRCVVREVVYLLIPTSNHNSCIVPQIRDLLYIFWFLHQTTTVSLVLLNKSSCISFDSYIKPQRLLRMMLNILVVYLLIPTSNHNDACLL